MIWNNMTSHGSGASNFRGFRRATGGPRLRETRSPRLRGRGPVRRRGALRGGGAAPDAGAPQGAGDSCCASTARWVPMNVLDRLREAGLRLAAARGLSRARFPRRTRLRPQDRAPERLHRLHPSRASPFARLHDLPLCDAVAEAQIDRPGEGRLGDAARAAGFQIERTVVEAEGLCPSCAEKADA
jgi:hypothetical protein